MENELRTREHAIICARTMQKNKKRMIGQLTWYANSIIPALLIDIAKPSDPRSA